MASSFTSIQKERRSKKNREKNENNKLSTLYTLTSKQVSKQRRKKTRKLQNSSITENWEFFSGSDCKQVSVSVSRIHNRSSTQKSAPKNENFVALRSSSSLVGTAWQRLLEELRRRRRRRKGSHWVLFTHPTFRPCAHFRLSGLVFSPTKIDPEVTFSFTLCDKGVGV